MTIYLVGSGHDALLRGLAARALGDARARGAPARPRVCAVLAATEGDPRLSAFMRKNAEGLFAGAEVVPFAGAKEELVAAHVVFVGGGDAAEGARVLARAGADAWLRDAAERGTTILGVSAGTIMLGAWWAEWPDEDAEGELVACTGVMEDLVLDCHAEDDDWVELREVQKLLAKRGDAKSYRFFGVPTGGALEVPAGTAGAGGSVRHLGNPPFVLG
jgi:peptidase S51-like protein